MDKHTPRFKALSDLTRLRALRLVLLSGESICVCELVDSLQLPQYRVSKHLSILRQAGLIEDSRVGTWVHYSVAEGFSEFVAGLCRLVTDSVTGPVFQADVQRLEERLQARADGRCVVGTTGFQFPKRRSAGE